MFGILISGMIFIFCLLIAFISQSIRSSNSKNIENTSDIRKQNFTKISKKQNSDNNLEIDPNDPNPTLFIMAPNSITNEGLLSNELVKKDQTFNSNLNSSSREIVEGTQNTNKEKEIYIGKESKSLTEEKITSSGLKIKDLIIGFGHEAISGQKVSVNYCGRLENGIEFDKRYIHQPFTFSIGTGQVIKGWDEGIAGMRVGGKRVLVIPSILGYGPRGAGVSIPPNATLIYEIQLLKVNS